MAPDILTDPDILTIVTNDNKVLGWGEKSQVRADTVFKDA